ncbi:MAG: CBS domain-containing membrane protein [Myxococcota bacterium]|jgi:CBS domain-containing membrane protein
MNPLETINRIMTRDVVTVQLHDSMSTVRSILRSRPFHHVPVLKGDLLVGMLSSADPARLALDAYVPDQETADAHLDAAFSVEAAMSPEPVSIQASDTVRRAAEILGDGDIHFLPVTDETGRLLGMVTSTDLIRYLARQYS